MVIKMKTVGIIAEYNPFHQGHLYQLEQAKLLTGATKVVVVMSGNFVQRGIPAIIDKYARTKMALSHGADLVIELPVCYATASAEAFAYAGISILDRLGFVDYVCFGSECGDIKLLEHLADILVEEPTSYQLELKKELKTGLSFPKARTKALLYYIKGKESKGYDQTSLELLLNSPNNILGIEYMKAIRKRKSKLRAITIKRQGAGYHDSDISLPNASATAIRNVLVEDDLFSLPKDLPVETMTILKQEFQKTYPIFRNDFTSLLYYKLSMVKEKDLTSYADVTPELANRIINNLTYAKTYDDFCLSLKTKELTLTRINRGLLHVLLSIPKTQNIEVSYARILGFRTDATKLLRTATKENRIPLIVKTANAKQLLNQEEYELFEQDVRATHLYHQMIFQKFHTYFSDEYTHGPVILKE
ncbi:nucleotidyltransferase [Lachnoclostridium phytofermentans]|uniref:tRNA(Met) cytidine acetate ligase n=1 Tax=Lachnoclostridium phytofermentans (strain ATCC 700394 / DSM 18823 / ISDg) TaxID=357809 RepID=A9KNV1_LACP7|nr:nucleotidyltransferase [Lachnoclostridium phytofermentans]ABX41702.1 protein of unknown function DUF795 [Lachnoclostridium phytofermentans ISDg]